MRTLTEELQQFTGTENYYRHVFGGKYTDGVAYLAENAKAYWLLDAIFSYHRKEPFQVWKLQLSLVGGQDAVLTMREDSDTPVIVEQLIEYTDFPIEHIELWLIDGVLILPSEY